MTSRALIRRGPASTLAVLLTAVLATALLAGCGAGSRSPERPQAERASSTTTEAAAAAPVKVVAVGDIACKPGYTVTSTKCRQAATARLTRSIDPAYVIGLGDLQYDSGTLAAYRSSYDGSWGSLKSRTRPLPGNHEYETAGARGYYRYFGRTSPGYYAWNAGTWRVYNLNSNCSADRLRGRGHLAARRPRGAPAGLHDHGDAPPAFLLRLRARQQRRAWRGSGRSPTTTASTWCWPATTTTTSASSG